MRMTSKHKKHKKITLFLYKISICALTIFIQSTKAYLLKLLEPEIFLLLLERFIIVTACLQPAEVKNCATIMTVHYFMTHDVFVSPFD